MVQNSSLTKMEALTGLYYLTESLVHFLSMGFTVQLGKLGYFKITVKSQGSPNPEDVYAGKLTTIKLHFYVSEAMRKLVRNFHISRFKKPGKKRIKSKSDCVEQLICSELGNSSLQH